jgi:hypothetical protein
MLGRAREAAALGDLDEGAELAQANVHWVALDLLLGAT